MLLLLSGIPGGSRGWDAYKTPLVCQWAKTRAEGTGRTVEVSRVAQWYDNVRSGVGRRRGGKSRGDDHFVLSFGDAVIGFKAQPVSPPHVGREGGGGRIWVGDEGIG